MQLRYNLSHMKNQSLMRIPALLSLAAMFLVAPRTAFADVKILLDDFESGVSKWTFNDNTKTANTPATLIDILPTAGTSLAANSRGAGLFTFKAAQKSWASASLRIDGAAWAKVGARQLSFYLNGGGNKTGVELILRRTQKNGQDEVFRLPWPVRLDIGKWRQVVIPLDNFKSDLDKKTPVTSRLNGVYLLQFAMRGDWDARFFTVDQLQIEGSGEPIVEKAPVAPPKPDATPPADAALKTGVTGINIDFLRTAGRLRPAANVTVGAGTNARGNATYPLQESTPFRSALRELKPRFIRLDAGELASLTDSGRPSFEFSRLKAAVASARAIGTQPLIVISNPPAWALEAGGYASFATQTARALSNQARYYELAVGDSDLNDAQVVAYYNAARNALKKISSNYRVGGVACSTGKTGTIRALLRSASGLDFLTVQDYGTWVGKPDDATLLKTAREASRLRAVAKQLDGSRWKNAPLYTIGNLSAVRTSSSGVPEDERTVQMISGAWWANYMAGASYVADQVFHNASSTPEWGLLDDAGRAYPAYYAMWLWNSFVPAGSTRVNVEASNTDISAIALNTPTAHNLLLVNNTGEDRTAQIGIRGFAVLRQARIRIYDDAAALPRSLDLPKSPYQTIVLKPYATAIVQFIEPPKN